MEDQQREQGQLAIAHTQSHDGMLKNAARIEETTSHHTLHSGNAEDVREGGRDGDADHAHAPIDARAAPAISASPPERRHRIEVYGIRRKKRKMKSYSHAHFKVYKRRWFGLAQLVLLNVVVSWDVRFAHLFLKLYSIFNMQDNADPHALEKTVADVCSRFHFLSVVLRR